MGPSQNKNSDLEVVPKNNPLDHTFEKTPKILSLHNSLQFSMVVPMSSQAYETNRSGIPAPPTVPRDFENVASFLWGSVFLPAKVFNINWAKSYNKLKVDAFTPQFSAWGRQKSDNHSNENTTKHRDRSLNKRYAVMQLES